MEDTQNILSRCLYWVTDKTLILCFVLRAVRKSDADAKQLSLLSSDVGAGDVAAQPGKDFVVKID